MGDLSDRFLGAYNRLDAVLRERTRSNQDASFSSVVERASKDRIVRQDDVRALRKMGQLRNAIVHDERYPSRSVAEPHEETVRDIEAIHAAVAGPKTVFSIAAKNPREYDPGDQLRGALQEMREGDFSQVVVRGTTGLQLLTTDGIASWVESKHDEELIELTLVKIGDILEHERPRRHKVVPRGMSLSEAVATFEGAAASSDDRLFAILVTNGGNRNEKCIGIVTPSDAFAAPMSQQ